jgi:hypothetical protein
MLHEQRLVLDSLAREEVKPVWGEVPGRCRLPRPCIAQWRQGRT